MNLPRIACVTGGTRGIGLGIARSLAKEGFRLVLCGLREAAEVEDILAGLRNEGADVTYLRCDVSNAGDRAALLKGIQNQMGGLHVLVNNAGVAPLQRLDVLDMTPESYDRLMHINLRGPWFLTQAAARWMIEQQQADPEWTGCIINVSSISATVVSPSRGEYCMTKAGLSMATQLWAVRLAEFNIPVYEIRPGVTATDMTTAVQEKYDRLIADGLIPQKRWGFPDDVGKAAASLARGDFPYSTGQVIMVDGGLTIPRL